jgi:hypothetical protein
MRWTMLILNLLAAVAFGFAGWEFAAADRLHAYSIYRELVAHKALVDKPTYTNGEPLDVEARIRSVAAPGSLSFLGYSGASACVLNGIVFFFSWRPHRPETSAPAVGPQH